MSKKIVMKNKEIVMLSQPRTIRDLLDDTLINNKEKIILAKINNRILELNEYIFEDGELEFIDISDKNGIRAFIRTLKFILIKATKDIFPDARITIEHSLSKGLFGEIHKKSGLHEEDILKIKERMKVLIEANIPINKIKASKDEAIEIFRRYGMKDKEVIFKYCHEESFILYELDGLYDSFYGFLGSSTGIINVFDLIKYNSGFILRFPTISNINNLPEFEEHPKLSKIFYESEKWANILKVGDVGALNKVIEEHEISELIRVNEALHEKKIAYIADMISDRKNIKLVSIAGPSSSGKTTFTKRLGIQLRVNGYKPILISLDDYFVDREKTPLDEHGEYDFESIYALDLELFNKHLSELLEGKEIELPEFNFKKGCREWTGRKISLPSDGILLIEGIHGLNEMLTRSINKENKFKIYISCLTQLNVDDHNRIPTTDVRTLRRIVRDSLSRGWNAERTLKMWPSIRRGEEKNIFVFQEEADVMFNSNLVYEVAVLKKYALKELDTIKEDSDVYYDVCRLKGFISMFNEVSKELVPDNSILREFIGGSYFYKY